MTVALCALPLIEFVGQEISWRQFGITSNLRIALNLSILSAIQAITAGGETNDHLLHHDHLV